MIFGGPETEHGDFSPHGRTFFCLAEKNSEFTTEISFCEFGFFSAKRIFTPNFPKVRRVGSQVHQKLFKSARILSGEKILKLGTPIEIAT